MKIFFSLSICIGNFFFCFRIFYHLCKLHYWELVYGKNYLNLTKIFLLRLFKMVTNQSAPGLDKGLLSNIWWLRCANHVKFTECVMFIKKHFLVKKKKFTNGLNLCVSLPAWVEKTVDGLETCWLSGKEKVLGIAYNKEGHADSILNSSLLITLKKVQL